MKTVSKICLAATALLTGAASVAAAPLAPGKAQNDGEKPTVYMVADAHLDTQWNWDIQTTIQEYVWNTINQNLKLLEKYPDYVFNFEGGVKYAFMKEYYPREYEMMKEYIKNGRWHISGASWDATDAVVPSTESAIRNIMLGQTFYRDEFGVESTDIFLPDCFGFPWTLPTVAKHCGLIGFSSQKLGWRQNPFYSGNRKYPSNVGLWKGVDGSEIMMAHGYGYGTRWDNEDLTEKQVLKDELAENNLGVLFRYYGTGDIGGSPSIQSVEAVERAVGKDGSMKIVSATSDQMFKDYQPYSAHPELPGFDGELLMDVHGTGCYTSQAAMKLYNRQNELLGDAAERAAVAAELLGTADYPGASLTEAWRRFIWHQFHDDLTGTSIPRAYEFSWNDELLSLKQFSDILKHSAGAVASQLDTRVKGTPVVLFNPLGYEATDIVDLEVPVKGNPGKVAAFDNNGKAVSAQMLGCADGKAHVLVEATVPANGFAVYDLRFSGSAKKATPVAANSIENSVYKITLDNNGDITSLYDKKAGRELVKPGKAIRLAIFTENESFDWPAWEVLKKTIDAEPQSINGNVSMELVEEGPLRSALRIEKHHGDSKFVQYIRLYEGDLADRIDFLNEVDWATTNALVKAEFPLGIANEKATYDLGIGTVERGNNTLTAYEVPSQRWADLTDKSGNYGVTVMNDSKYGWDKPDDNTIRLTLLHTPKTKRGYTYQDHQDFGHHVFTYSLNGHSGSLDKADANRRADVLNQRIKGFSATRHAGDLGRSFSLASLDNKDLAIRALKKAESSDEYVVRVYDTAGKGGKGKVTFARPLTAAVAADGTEKTIGSAAFAGNTLDVDVTPNSVRTYKVKFAPAASASTDSYASVPLDYNKKCFSWDCFSGDADFNGGYSYAAELVPASLTASGVPFTLENKELLNGMACKGDTLKLPEGNFNRLYILAAATTEDASTAGTFRTVAANKKGKSTSTELTVPSYTGFIGQWGHTDHTEGFVQPDEVAFAGTHRHSGAGNHPYEFTYMFKYGIDLPAGTREVILPDNPELVIFAATAANEANPAPEALTVPFRTANVGNVLPGTSAKDADRKNILKPEQIVAWSGFANDREKPAFMNDGNPKTKWCDTNGVPAFVEYDLGSKQPIHGWSVLNAGSENPSYITVSCLLQVRNDKSEEWKTIDNFVGNKRNVVERKLATPVEARYLRLFVVQPEQSAGGRNTRIHEFNVY